MYISDYKIVKLLNQKGFDLPIKTSSPTITDAINWLLQKNIFVQVEYCFDDFDSNKTAYFFPRIVNTKTSVNIRLMNQFSEPEKATEYGIGYILEKML
jgi:hypothetical protein